MHRILIILLIAASSALQAAPDQVSYQGYLQDADGAARSGLVDLQIGVWNDAASTDASAQLYLEDHFGVVVSNGLFTIPLGGGSVVLGNFDADLFADNDRWLQITVEGEPLAPRTKFLSVPYAFQAGKADSLSGLSGAVMHFALPECPSGWSELTAARGRTLVGLPDGGNLAGVTGTALGNLETRQHSHNVSPPTFSTSTISAHSHGVSSRTTSTDTHAHRWSRWVGSVADWRSWNSSGVEFTITDTGNGLDLAGAGVYPIAASSSGTTSIYTDRDSHNHTISSFSTSSAGAHSHTVSGPAMATSVASQSPTMPYMQLLVCVKD